MQPSRKRKRPPTPEQGIQNRSVRRVRLSGPFMLESDRLRDPSRSVQRPVIEQAIENPALNQSRRHVFQNPLVEPIQLTQADLQALRASFRRQPRFLLPRDSTILPIRLFTRKTYTAEDIWRVVYFRHGSVDDFSKKILSFADVSKLTGIPQETVRRQLDQFEKDGFTVFIRRHYNGNLGSDPKIFLKMEERLKSV